jgi:hypothetical protein
LRGDLRIVYLDAQTSHDPVVEVRDPGVIFQNRSVSVELPKCYLEGKGLINGMIARMC